MSNWINKFHPVTVCDPIDPEQPSANVATGEPILGASGLVVSPTIGWADNPIRIDPTGVTVQPVAIVSGGTPNASVSPTGQPAPLDATFIGGVNTLGNLVGLIVDGTGALVVTGGGGGGGGSNTGAAFGTVGQVVVSSTATLILATGVTRRSVKVTNLGPTDVWLGFTNAVTTTTGDLLIGARGAFVSIPTTLPIYGIVGSGTQTVSFAEVYD